MFERLIEMLRGDSLLDSALKDTLAMLEESQLMINETIRSLRHSDTGEINFNIYEKDVEINKLQREVRRKVITNLTVSSFAKSADVAPALAVTSIIIDVERLGDYAKNIWELAVNHPDRLICGSLETEIAQLENAVDSKYGRVIAAVRDYDEEAALGVINDYTQVSKSCDRLIERLIKEDISELTKGDAVATALYTRYIKRINGHLTNITTSVINPFHRIGYQPKVSDSKQ